MQRDKVVIKKYENRRLYDTAASRYVNLDEVAQMVREGVDVQVVDAANGEDLTRLILTQIIMEDAKGRNSGLPLDMLRQMVMTSGANSQEALLKYMKSTIEIYQNAYRAFAPAATPLDFMRSLMGSGWPAGTASASPAPPQAATEQTVGGAATEVDELRRRVEELEKIFAQQTGAQAKPKKPKGGR